METPVITIDGLSATGKTVIASMLSKRLGWPVLFSGMLYRCLAYHIIQQDLQNMITSLEPEWLEDLENVVCQLDDQLLTVTVNGRDLSNLLIHESVAARASQIAKDQAVRDLLLPIQRRYRVHPGLVAEGRDMSSTVFPDANIKVFLMAEAGLRAQRRYDQLKKNGKDDTMSHIVESMLERDKSDMERAEASRGMDDALVIDTTHMNLSEVFSTILASWS
ncbi:MAG: (d)CMP kinase [Pseudomonadota bacterium]|nr:(d)CMP kinase [Pseudomonadota bacterium]